MLTLFTTAKAFNGHNALIQRNALKSWALLRPQVEVLLFGSDDGSAEIAQELGFRHIPSVACNDYGTPLIGDIFEQAQKLAANPIVCYINADIVLFDDFLPAVKYASEQRRQFLMVGQRTDLDVTEPITFDPGWEEKWKSIATRDGKLHGKGGVDYFVFPKGALGPIPAFAIGRGVWDNWLMYRARSRNIAFIDATPAVQCIHQNHDYKHIADGKDNTYLGPEREVNLQLGGGKRCMLTLDQITDTLSPNKDSYRLTEIPTSERIISTIVYHPVLGPMALKLVEARRTLLRRSA